MKTRSIFSLILAAAAGFAQVTPDSGQTPLLSEAFGGGWSILLPRTELGSADWRVWVSEKPALTHSSRRWVRGIPGATVEVVDSLFSMHQDRVRELNLAFAPVMVHSFRIGEASSITSQMLSEFMAMHGANFQPPTIPSVWYNGLIPYWVQQEMRTSSGVNVSAVADSRPKFLYPTKH